MNWQTVTNWRIEIVDRMGAGWGVPAAARWWDARSPAVVLVVPRCTSKATRCVTVRPGALGTRNRTVLFGWSKGTTITIDAGKLRRYRANDAATRRWLVTHELGHQLGKGHSAGNNVMYPYARRLGKVPRYVAP